MDPSTMSTASKPSVRRILSETLLIVTGANSGHFLLLSLLFLFPIQVSSLIYLYFFPQFNFPVSYPQNPNGGKSHLLATILFYLFTMLFSLSATASITYSTIRVFNRMPVDLISSLKSIRISFFPLLATQLTLIGITWLITFVSCIGFSILMMLIYGGLALLGYQISFSYQYAMIYVIIFTVLLLGVVFYALVEWDLWSAVVVVESQWGVAALKRSSHLVKGMRWVVLWIILLLNVVGLVFSFLFFRYVMRANGGGFCLVAFIQMLVYTIVVTLLYLFVYVANTVLFVYSKDFHGEVDSKTDLELGLDYAKVPSVEDKKFSSGFVVEK